MRIHIEPSTVLALDEGVYRVPVYLEEFLYNPGARSLQVLENLEVELSAVSPGPSLGL